MQENSPFGPSKAVVLYSVVGDAAVPEPCLKANPSRGCSTGAFVLRNFNRVKFEPLFTDLLQHDAVGVDSFILHGVRDAAHSLLTSMVRVGAYEGHPNVAPWECNESEEPVVAEMVDMGYVCYVPDDFGGGFVLTKKALQNLEHVYQLSAGVAVALGRPGDQEDKTALELINDLEAEGFTWRRLPKKRSDRLALQYTVGDEVKHWYTVGVTPCKPYLQCLLKARELQKKGVEHIPHYGAPPDAFYTQLLQGKVPTFHDQKPRTRTGATGRERERGRADHLKSLL